RPHETLRHAMPGPTSQGELPPPKRRPPKKPQKNWQHSSNPSLQKMSPSLQKTMPSLHIASRTLHTVRQPHGAKNSKPQKQEHTKIPSETSTSSSPMTHASTTSASTNTHA